MTPAPRTAGTDIEPVGQLGAELVKYLAGDGLPTIEDPALVQARIVATILTAETVEGVFDNTGSTATKEMVGKPIRLLDVQLRASAIEDNASPVYALLEVADITSGEIKALNTGSPRIMAQACRAKDLGALPLDCRVIEVGAAKPGQNAPLGLELIAA